MRMLVCNPNLNPEAKVDPMTKNLLVEVSRTVLRVLDPEARALPRAEPEVNPSAVPTPWGTTTNTEADKGRPKSAKAALPASPPRVMLDTEPRHRWRGAVVRFWDGDKWATGEVASIPRAKEGAEVKAQVRVSRAGNRGQRHLVPVAKLEVLHRGTI